MVIAALAGATGANAEPKPPGETAQQKLAERGHPGATWHVFNEDGPVGGHCQKIECPGCGERVTNDSGRWRERLLRLGYNGGADAK